MLFLPIVTSLISFQNSERCWLPLAMGFSCCLGPIMCALGPKIA